IKELTLSISSTPHHATLPPINHSIERNHGSQIVSMRVLQQNRRQTGRKADITKPTRMNPGRTCAFLAHTFCRHAHPHPEGSFQRGSGTKLDAALGLPAPAYFARSGYGYTGRERSTTPAFERDAIS